MATQDSSHDFNEPGSPALQKAYLESGCAIDHLHNWLNSTEKDPRIRNLIVSYGVDLDFIASDPHDQLCNAINRLKGGMGTREEAQAALMQWCLRQPAASGSKGSNNVAPGGAPLGTSAAAPSTSSTTTSTTTTAAGNTSTPEGAPAETSSHQAPQGGVPQENTGAQAPPAESTTPASNQVGNRTLDAVTAATPAVASAADAALKATK